MAVLCCCISGVTQCTLYMVLYPMTYLPVRVTLGALVAHRYTYAPPCYRTSQYHRIFIPISISPWNDLDHPVFDCVIIGGSEEQGQCLFIGLAARSLFVFCFPFLFFLCLCCRCGAGVFDLLGCKSISHTLALSIMSIIIVVVCLG